MQIVSFSRWLVAAAVSALVMASPATAQSDTLASVKQKGKLVVGVKADYKPFGYTDSSGKIVGLEIDLAQDVAKRLLGAQIGKDGVRRCDLERRRLEYAERD